MPNNYNVADGWRSLQTSLHASYLKPCPDAATDDYDDSDLDTPARPCTFFSDSTPDIVTATNLTHFTFLDSPPTANNRLPPTPPSLSRLQAGPSSARTHDPARKHSNPSTPPNYVGLPTPDTTPPTLRSRSYLAAPQSATPHGVTSNTTLAESFATAQEDWLSMSPSDSHLRLATPDGHVDKVRLGSVSSSRGNVTDQNPPSSRIQSSEARFSDLSTSTNASETTISPDAPLSTSTFLASSSSLNETPRPSMESSASSTVKALIIDHTPPSKQRKLRHMNKAGNLKHGGSSPSSPTKEHFDASSEKAGTKHKLKRSQDRFSLREEVKEQRMATSPRELAHLTPDFSTWPTTPSRSKHTPRKSTDNSVRSFALSTLGPTPVSDRSGFSGPLELHEATAVQLFSHNNNSLVVVQHTPSAAQSTTITPLAMSTATYADVTSESLDSQPRPLPVPSIRAEEAEDSPLMRPRTAPKPPVVYVSPPSQDSTTLLDDQGELLEDIPSQHAMPTRRPSFLARARAASADVLTNASGSLKRSRFGSLRRGHNPPSSFDRPDSTRSTPTKHDPFRTPTRFWPDQDSSAPQPSNTEFSQHTVESQKFMYHNPDTNSPFPSVAPDTQLPTESAVKDFAIGRGGEEEIGMNPYSSNPANGDPELSRWESLKRGGSIKGFLIGNTLGISRGPTNKRRHVVILPSMVEARGRLSAENGLKRRQVRSASAPVDVEASRRGKTSWWSNLKASLRPEGKAI